MSNNLTILIKPAYYRSLTDSEKLRGIESVREKAKPYKVEVFTDKAMDRIMVYKTEPTLDTRDVQQFRTEFEKQYRDKVLRKDFPKPQEFEFYYTHEFFRAINQKELAKMSSEVTNNTNLSNFSDNRYDLRKTFVYGNRYEQFQFLNDVSGVTNYGIGFVLALNASEQLVPWRPAAGSNNVFGILAEPITNLAFTATAENISVCVFGDVAREQVIVSAGSTLATVVDGLSLASRLNLRGIKLVRSIDLQTPDN